MNKNRLKNIENGFNANECTVVVCISNEDGCAVANENDKCIMKMYKNFDEVKELYTEGEVILVNITVSKETEGKEAEFIGIEIHRNSEKELSIDKVLKEVKELEKRSKEYWEKKDTPIT